MIHDIKYRYMSLIFKRQKGFMAWQIERFKCVDLSVFKTEHFKVVMQVFLRSWFPPLNYQEKPLHVV
jgi:hypothetical protein